MTTLINCKNRKICWSFNFLTVLKHITTDIQFYHKKFTKSELKSCELASKFSEMTKTERKITKVVGDPFSMAKHPFTG